MPHGFGGDNLPRIPATRAMFAYPRESASSTVWRGREDNALVVLSAACKWPRQSRMTPGNNGADAFDAPACFGSASPGGGGFRHAIIPRANRAGVGVPGCRALPGGASQIFALVAMLPMPTWAYCFDLR